MKFHRRFPQNQELNQSLADNALVEEARVIDHRVNEILSGAAPIFFILAVPLVIWIIQVLVYCCRKRCVKDKSHLDVRYHANTDSLIRGVDESQ